VLLEQPSTNSSATAMPFDVAMGDYQRARDQHAMPMYEFTCSWQRWSRRPRSCSGCSADPRQCRGHGRLRQDECRHAFAAEVLCAPTVSAPCWRAAELNN
jgi:hypothetical protein